jgi:phage terminase small subunit
MTKPYQRHTIDIDGSSLTVREWMFVEYYLSGNSGKKSARMAGYPKHCASSRSTRLLQRPRVREAIKRRIKHLQMTADEVLLKLSLQARASIEDLIYLPEDLQEIGEELRVVNPEELEVVQQRRRLAGHIDFAKAQRTGALQHVKRLKWSRFGPEIELYDGQKALELLGRYFKLFGDDGKSLMMAMLLKSLDMQKLTIDQLHALSSGEDPVRVLLGPATIEGESRAGTSQPLADDEQRTS